MDNRWWVAPCGSVKKWEWFRVRS